MNLFVLDHDPKRAAQFHNDRHVSKQLLETAQMLSMAHTFLDGVATARARVPIIQRPTHVMHPNCVWVRSSTGNYEWAHALLCALAAEWTLRFHTEHQYARVGGVVEQLAKKPMNLPVGSMTAFPQCMPSQFKRSSAVDAYRVFYHGEKQHLAQWTVPRSTPEWWTRMDSKGAATG